MTRRAERTLLVFAVMALAIVTANAQEQHAALEGLVRDTQGGAMPGVLVVARTSGGLTAEAVRNQRPAKLSTC